jgi:multidrug resistance protein, MATE family
MTGQRRPSCGEVVEDVHYLDGEDKFNHPGRSSDVVASTFWMESRLFLELATTTTLLTLGFILSPLMTASYIGRRFGPVFLSGFTLANLTGNLCTFSIMSGVLSASDTLSPQAFGTGDYREVGLLAIRGAVSCFAILLPINIILVLYLESGLVALGQDPMAASYAMSWYRIFVLSLPFNIISQTMWKFLSAQRK